jgi:hypothetical protein
VTVLPTTPGATVNTTSAPANSATLPGGWDPADPDLDELFGTTLPTGTAPVFPSTLDVPTGLEPFNETVALDAVTRSVMAVVDVPFSLVPQTATADMVTRSLFVSASIVLARVPATSLELSALAPVVSVSRIPVPSIPLTLTALAPDARGSIVVPVPVTTLTLTTLVPNVVGDGFSPLDLSPVAWWDASDSGTITTSSGLITDWNDKSGNAVHLTQATSGNRPTYTTAGINGLNVATWPSTDNSVFMASADASHTVKEFYVVARFANSNFSNYEGLLNPRTDPPGDWFTASDSGGGLFTGGSEVYLNANNSSNRVSDMRTEMSSTCLFRWVKTSGTVSTTTGFCLGNDRSNFALGRGWNGEICEVVVCSGLLSAGDRGDLETYLMDKWGIP